MTITRTSALVGAAAAAAAAVTAIGGLHGGTPAGAAGEGNYGPDPVSVPATAATSATSPAAADARNRAGAPVQLWAVVTSAGRLSRSHGAVGSGFADRFGYQVAFNRSIRNCVFEATIGIGGSTGVEAPGGITVAARNGNPNAIYVQTTDPQGRISRRAFHLLVTC